MLSAVRKLGLFPVLLGVVSVLYPLLFLLYSSDLPTILGNTLVSYADDSTLLAEEPEPGKRVLAVLSINRDLARIIDWCKRWEIL